MHGAFCPVDVSTGFSDNFPGGFWKMPSVVGRKRREDCFVVFAGSAVVCGDTRTFFACLHKLSSG
jgi:hypothetical protein